ncbi:hypothetical protein PSOS111911_20350 [Pseudoalteromonas ostreae]
MSGEGVKRMAIKGNKFLGCSAFPEYRNIIVAS